MPSQPQIRQAGAKRVAGLALRTDNATEARAGGGKIPGLWERYRREDWFGRLEKLGAFGPPIGVYSAYDSDVKGSFQILAGREIPSSVLIPASFADVAIPSGKYLVFESTGPLPGSVVAGWQAVWAHFARHGAAQRSYTCDFEIYPSDHEVEIWVSVA
jgi:predicted transcriptional regulator YdeE